MDQLHAQPALGLPRRLTGCAIASLALSAPRADAAAMPARTYAANALVFCLLLTGCATVAPPKGPQEAFFDRLIALCGQRLEGRIVSPPVAADADFAGKTLIAHVRDCSPQEMRIPFQVGNDKSRTWIVTRTSSGLRLKHDHRHEDGTEDRISQYGGDTLTPGTAHRQEFPADLFTRELLVREGNVAGAANVWSMEAGHPSYLAYELRRPGRFFRVEFGQPGKP
jgi:hypothetical protein